MAEIPGTGDNNAKETNRLSLWEEERAENAFDCQKTAPRQAGSGEPENDDVPLIGGHHPHKAQRDKKKAARDRQRTES